ncbi:MAG: hypothetical protein ACD_15C00133G0036 [uncultured bacterium]|nr:MAG: hypothetical protein ACD_15C00133G0036 [uncultured bacterium]
MKITQYLFGKIFFICLIFLFLVFDNVSANESSDSSSELKSAFRSFSVVSVPAISVPTVIEAPVDFRDSMMKNVMLMEKQSQKTQPVIVLDRDALVKNAAVASDSLESGRVDFLVDGKMETFLEYPASGSGEEQEATISVKFGHAIAASSLNFYLDRFVSLPENVEISAIVDGKDRIILAKKEVLDSRINFPKTTAQEFKISLEYIQPLRIRELSINQEDLFVVKGNSIRFLAQPNKNYELYYDADRYVETYKGEMPDLNDDRDVLIAKKLDRVENPFYMKSDIDKDGVADEIDNCVIVENPSQEDVNSNNQGDACDDFDRDGIINAKDNCRDLPNRDQKDTDLDGIGNVCDEKESRVLQNQKWLPLTLIILVAGIIGIFFVKTIKTKE